MYLDDTLNFNLPIKEKMFKVMKRIGIFKNCYLAATTLGHY